MKRFIFDLDGTLINTKYEKELKYFNDVFPNNDFGKHMSEYLWEYESTYYKYDTKFFLDYISKKTGCKFTEEIFDGWQDFFSKDDEEMVEGALDLLKFLKENDKDVIVLTNWYTDCQTKRLKNLKLLDYVDKVYGGDICLKPNKDAFINACGDVDFKDCIMIGDTYKNDIEMPKNLGMEALLINDKHKSKYKNKIKSLEEVKEWI